MSQTGSGSVQVSPALYGRQLSESAADTAWVQVVAPATDGPSASSSSCCAPRKRAEAGVGIGDCDVLLLFPSCRRAEVRESFSSGAATGSRSLAVDDVRPVSSRLSQEGGLKRHPRFRGRFLPDPPPMLACPDLPEPEPPPGMSACHQLLRLDATRSSSVHMRASFGAARPKSRSSDLVALGGRRKSMADKRKSRYSVVLSEFASPILPEKEPAPRWEEFFSAEIVARLCRLLFLLGIPVMLALLVSLVLVTVDLGNSTADQLMVDHGMLPPRGDPTYLLDFLSGKCQYLKVMASSLVKSIETSNKLLGWQRVSFPARDGRQVSGLLFPSPTRPSPRVVIAHGLGSDPMSDAALTAAFLLRAMNISVLVPALRDLAAGPKVDWHDQYLDLLGAWDYAVADPNALLGGRSSSSSVGLMGFEFGGLAALDAFNTEPNVRALLLDGAVVDVKSLLFDHVEQATSLRLLDLIAQQAVSRVEYHLSRSLAEERDRLAALRSRGAFGGTVGIFYSVDDSIVLPRQEVSLEEAFTEANAPGFNITSLWLSTFREPSTCTERRETYLDRQTEYQSRLCTFWLGAFYGLQPADSQARCAVAAAQVPPLAP